MEIQPDFRDQVYDLVAGIPKGRVMSYGQIAALCGRPRASRIVGQIAHFGPTELPWQRVVKQDGALAEGYYNGQEGHRSDLRSEGVEITDWRVDMKRYRWWPDA